MNETAGSPGSPAIFGVLGRGLLVGGVYTVLAIVGTLLAREQIELMEVLTWLIGGTLTCLVIVPFVRNSEWSKRKTVLAAWLALALVGPIGLGIEGALFRPVDTGSAIGGAVFGIITRLAIVLGTVMLFQAGSSAAGAGRRSRRGLRLIAVLLAGALAYLVLYFVFGAANFLLYTGPFYRENPQYGLELPAASIVFTAQLLRAPMMAAGAVLMGSMVHWRRTRLAVGLGLFLYVVGGFAPYFEEVFLSMPIGFNLTTLAELFLQNFGLGVIMALLVRRRMPSNEMIALEAGLHPSG